MKLVAPANGTWELYDLASDRSELNDLIVEMPQAAAELATLWYHVAEAIERAPEKLRRRLNRK